MRKAAITIQVFKHHFDMFLYKETVLCICIRHLTKVFCFRNVILMKGVELVLSIRSHLAIEMNFIDATKFFRCN